MSGELFLLKSVPVNSFLSILFDLFNVSLSLCTSFLPVEDTMKANHTDSQITLPPLPTGLYGCIFCARDRSLMWGAGKKHYNHKVLQLVQPQKDALRETDCCRGLCPSPVQWGNQEETMIQQVTTFLPDCSTGLWIKLKIDDLAFKWEGGQSFLINLIMIQIPRNPSVIYTHISR